MTILSTSREFGPEEMAWWALYTRHQHEKAVSEILDRYWNGDSRLTFFIYQMVNAELWRERWLVRP